MSENEQVRGRVLSAEEISAMTPDERLAHFKASVVDPSTLAPEVLERSRLRMEQLIRHDEEQARRAS
jgi:hypothetical protein